MTPLVVTKVARDTLGSVAELMDIFNDLNDRNVSSLTQFTKKTLITSRVYVEDQIASEEVVPKIMKLLNSMYSGFVMCALGMNNLFVGGRTVREMFEPVATEDFKSFLDVINNEFGDKVKVTVATEDAKKDMSGENDDTTVDNAHQVRAVNEKEMKAIGQALFSGRLLEMQIPCDGGKTIPLYFYVQLLPIVTPTKVMIEFLQNNASPSLSLRWAMWKAGEISFWKDFVFECDRVAKRRKALKVDRDGILREIEDHKSVGFMKSLTNFINNSAATRRRNDANVIVICTKRTLDEACKDLGISMKNYSDRQKLLNGIMAAMLVTLDPNYGTVDLYMNGINGRGEYTAKTIEAATKGDKEGIDVKELLALISAGNMPRF